MVEMRWSSINTLQYCLKRISARVSYKFAPNKTFGQLPYI